jgi:hypothetical protein
MASTLRLAFFLIDLSKERLVVMLSRPVTSMLRSVPPPKAAKPEPGHEAQVLLVDANLLRQAYLTPATAIA